VHFLTYDCLQATRLGDFLTFVWWLCFVFVHIKVMQRTLIPAFFSKNADVNVKGNVRLAWRDWRLNEQKCADLTSSEHWHKSGDAGKVWGWHRHVSAFRV
jgi:hypothetical protein